MRVLLYEYLTGGGLFQEPALADCPSLLREGAAMLSALRAAINALRDLRAGRSRKRAEDEDALFI